ncbi:MAG: BREX system Lon protease-like protein BrxL, partial [Chloroflexota bacterium]
MHTDLFDELPQQYYDSAFLDRIHFYVPGWEVEIIRGEMFSEGYGFVVDYLAEILRTMRSYDFSHHYREHFELSNEISTRDRDGINKTFSGLMKIIYPHGEATLEEIEALLVFSIEGRKRVKDQLMRIDTTYAPVKFVYQNMPGNSEISVKTQEEKDYPQHYYQKAGFATPVDEAVLLEKTEMAVEQPPELSITEIIAQGESESLEFKSTLQWDTRQNEQNKGLRKSVLKTIVAFLNSDGGSLLIGVEDSGQIYGLENDLNLLTKSTLDGFSNTLTSLITDFIGPEFFPFIKIRFESLADQHICVVDVGKGANPVYYEDSNTSEFYTRFGATSRQLNPKETVAYIGSRWK